MKKFLFFLTLFLLGAGMSFAQNVIFVKSGVTDGETITVGSETGKAYNTVRAAVDNASVGDIVKLTEDVTEEGTKGNSYGVCVAIIDRITIDGNGYSISGTGMSGTYSSVFYFKGGTIQNFSKITGGFRTIFSGGGFTADTYIDNCVIDAGSGAYPFNTDAANINYSVTITNCEINGWCSYTGDFKSFTISNTTFGQGTSGYAYFIPYSPTFLSDVTFDNSGSEGYAVDARQDRIVFNNCDVAGTTVTTENITTLLGSNSINKAVIAEGTYSADAEGRITGGIYGGNLAQLNQILADGYEAFALGTDPETYQVDPVYYIHFNSNGGTGTMADSYVDQTNPTFTVPDNTEFTNGSWTFNTWNTKADGTGDTYAPGSPMTLSSDTTLYAQWKGVAKIGDVHYTTLNAAAAAVPVGTPTTITILQNLNFYDIAQSNIQNKTITFTGTPTDTLTLTNAAHKTTNASGADLTFENITLKNDDVEYGGVDVGIIHSSKVSINKCEVIGFMKCYPETFICDSCTFTKTAKFHLWTYSSNCTFNNCTFNSYNNADCKAINVYWNNVTDPYRVMAFNDCAFNSIPAVTTLDNSAIQVNSAKTCFVLYVNNCTVNGYINNDSTAVPECPNLVNNKSGSVRTTLYLNGVKVLKQSDCDPVAKIGDTYYNTLQAAVDASHAMHGDVTIEVLRDISERALVNQDQANLNLTINGNGHNIYGSIWIDGHGDNWQQTNSLTITDVNFKYNSSCAECYSSNKGFIYFPTKTETGGHYNYAHNVTIQNCDFDDGGNHNIGCLWMPANSGSQGNIKLDGNTVTSAHSLVQFNSASFKAGSSSDTAVVITNCVANETLKHGINITGGGGKFIIANNKITANVVPGEGYSIRIKNQSGGACTSYLSNNEFNAPAEGMIFSGNTATGDTIYIKSGLYIGNFDDTDSPTNLCITGGTYTDSKATVNTKCAPGYAAYDDEGTSPQTCTVVKMNWVTFDANGGTGTMDTVYVDPRTPQTVTVPACTFTYTGGIEFLEWNTKADGTGTPFAAGATMAIESDTTLYAQWGYVAMIGTTPYATLQAAVDSANKNMTGDVTIDLVQNTSEVVTVLQKAENNLTINGNGNTLTGQMFISSNQEGDIWNGTDKINITNLKFAYDENYFNLEGSTDYWKTDGFIVFCRNCFFTSKLNYAHNVTISDCKFDGAGSTQKIYAVKSGASGGVNKVVLENCTAKNVLGLAELQSTANFTVTGCTATENVDRGLYIAGSKGNHHITNNTITATEYAVHIQYQTTTGTTDSLSGNTFEAPVVFKLDHNESPNVTLDITSGTYKGTINDQDASTIFNIAGGTYSEDVTGEPCAPGYAAFANGTNPETWTVTKAWFLYYDKNEASASGTMDTVFVKQSDPDAGRTVTVANCDFTLLPDHSFLAWNTKANALGDTLRPGDNIILSSDTTLYVIWQEGYTIFYDNNGGVGTIPNQYKAVDETITLSDGTDGAGNYLFTKTDSTLYRWNTAADESGDNYALGAEYSANDNVTMYAVWRLNLDMTMDSTDVVCYGENNGTDTVKIIGGDAPYMLVLSSSVLPQNDTVKDIMDTKYVFKNLKPGSYNVELSDVLKKDFITGHFTIAQPDTLIVETMTVPVKPCPLMGTGVYNVSMTTTGGNGDNHFVWSDAAVNDDAMATTVIPGADDRDSTYTVTVTVTDKKGCTATRTETFSVSPVIADDGTVHANSKLTTNPDTIKVGIYQGCDTIIRDFGTYVFTSTNPAIDVNILDTVYNDVDVNYPDSTFPVGYSTIIWTATDTCGHRITGEQVVYIYHFPCPDVDLDGYTYHSVRLGCTCWTNENLRAEKYSDGRPIENVMTYVSDLHPNTTENANIYGHLYDWYAAVDTETNSIADIEATYALGKHIQGICPDGWYLPNDENFDDFDVYDTKDLRSTDNWLISGGSGAGTNATGFNAEPSGFYDCATGRFEDLGTSSFYWSCHPVLDMATGAMIAYVCERLQKPKQMPRCNGLSVRCVLIYE